MNKPLIAALAVLGILFATYSLWPSSRRVTPEMVERPRVCDACGHRFDGPTEPVVVECPECGKRAGVRAQFYQCRKCGHRFEAYWVRTQDTSLEAIDDTKPPPELAYKRPDGQWVDSKQKLGKILCPECGSAQVGSPPPR